MRCDCGATNEGKYAGMHTEGCASLQSESMDVNSREAALWSETMVLKSENEHLRALLRGAKMCVTCGRKTEAVEDCAADNCHAAKPEHWLAQSRGEAK